MLIYDSTKKEFLEDVSNKSLLGKLYSNFREKIGRTSGSEIDSWTQSMDYMYKLLSPSNLPDNCGIAVEFKIPLTSNRIDFVISGYDEENNPYVFIIELKGWGKATKVEGKQAIVKTFTGKRLRETTHPSYQAWTYKSLVKDFNETIQRENIKLLPCAYLYNFEKRYENELRDKEDSYYVNEAPIYLKDDDPSLREFMEKYLKKGDDKKNLYKIEKGEIKPSKSLRDALNNMIAGKREFKLVDSQKIIYENALDMAKKSSKDKKKRVVVVEGGPGTGKSVLAINLLVAFNSEKLFSQYVSKNATPRDIYSKKLKGDYKKKYIDGLFSGSGSFHNKKKNFFDALIVDEAHRLNEKSGMMKNLGENQVKEIISSSRTSVFFIDESQRVTLHDIGSKEEIEKHAKQQGAEISFYTLESQFRCFGSEGYISWLDDVLGIRKTANPDGFDFYYYDIKIPEKDFYASQVFWFRRLHILVR